MGWWCYTLDQILPTIDYGFSSLMLLISSLLLCFITSILGLILWLRKSNSYLTLPPSPPSLPIIGHLHLLGNLPHHSLHNLSKLYGPFFSLRLGSVPAIVASSPDMAREILQTHDLTFAYRPKNAVAKYAIFDSSDIGFSSGPYWRLMRQICLTDLFSNKRIQDFRPVRTQEVMLLLQAVLQDSKNVKEVPIRSRLLSTTNNIISRMTLGKKFSELAACSHIEASPTNIVSLLTELMYLLGMFNIGDFIPALQWMDLQGYVRRSKNVGEKFKSIFQEIIDARREKRRMDSSSAPKDLLDVLLSAAEDKKQEVPVNDDNIKGVLVDMFAGGSDTSTNTIEWALAELLRNPHIMKKLEDELDNAVGKERLVQESDLPQLPYLTAT